jgi:hypothetical protein
MMGTDFQTGFSTDLIRGLNPAWDPRVGQLNILYAPKQQAMAGKPVAPIAHRGTWSYPEITLHDDALSLLDELIAYHVVSPSSEIDAPVIKAGALLCGAQDSKAPLNALSTTLGVDLSNTDLRYALVKLTRVDGTEPHASAASGILIHARPRQPDPEYGIRKNFASAVVKLPHAGRSRQQDYGAALSQHRATRILDSFAEFGTHYVSAVSLGDTILQVFAYPAEQFETIKKAYADAKNPLSGHGSQVFAQFTTDLRKGIFGFVTQYGNLLNLSNSAVFNNALRKGDWFEPLWSHQNSILSPFNADSSLSLVNLQENYRDQVVVDIQLASLSVMIEQKRGLIWQRVFKGAMVQKYRSTIVPNFAVYDERDFVRMLPEDQTGVLSYIATPTINVYKTRINLQDMQFVAAGEVRDLTIFANVLSADAVAAMRLPGQQIRLFAQIMDMRSKGQPKHVTVADSAFGTLQIACDEFLGALALQSQSGQAFNVIVDGLQFALDDGYPVIAGDVRTVPPVSALPHLVDSLQYSMAFAEGVMSNQSSGPIEGVRSLVRGYLTWLAKFIPAKSEDPGLVALRVRAMDLANYAMNPDYGSFVPILPFSDYEDYVDRILSYLQDIGRQIADNEQRLAARREKELITDVAKTLNQNIVESGKLISGIIDANAAQQSELEGYYDSLITQKQAEADQQQLKLNGLRAALFTAQGDMDAAIQKYKSAVQQWQAQEEIKFGLDVATNLFSLTTTVAIPASSINSVKELGNAVQQIQKTLNVLNALSKLYTGASTGLKGLQGAQSTLDGLDGAQFGSPSSVNWEEMSIWFSDIIATGPDIKPAKSELQRAFSILILRGKAVTNADSALHQIQRDIYTNQQQKELNARQAQRWRNQQGKLQPAKIENLDKNVIDLIGMSGYLENIQKQMLTILAKAFLQQDLALQYAFLQPATPVTSFSLTNFNAALVTQKNQMLDAKSQLAQYQAARTKPIEFVIDGVHPEQVTDGNTFTATIFLNAPEFFSYVDARVVSVVATVEGVKASDGGTYHLRLAFNGTPFYDRDIKRDALTFRTPWRERIYAYKAADNSATFSDRGKSWSEGVSRVTPFGTWEISFPNSQVNKGLNFAKDLLTFRLSFVLEARIADPANLMRLRAEQRSEALLRRTGVLARNIAGLVAGDRSIALLGAAAQAQPSTADLIAQMYAQGSCTNGWDVVFNLGLTEINQALKTQYEAFKKDPAYKSTITVNTSEQYPGFTAINKFKINYGYPLLNFSINNNETAVLQMEILDGSSVQRCSKVGDGPEECYPPESITGETLTAVIGLAKVTGNVEVDGSNHNVLKVVLDMAEGAFTISNIQLSDATKAEFNKEVKAYFVNHSVVFLINQLDLTNIPTLEALKPTDFFFKPLQTPSSTQMLQLFIMTGGRALLNYSQAFLNNIPEPLPLGQSSSMMIRSQLVFKDILPQTLQNGSWALVGVDPGSAAKAWSAKVSSGSVIGTVNLGLLDHSTSPPASQGSGSTTRYTYSIPGGNDVSWSLADTTFTAQSDGQLLYSGSRSQELWYNEHSCTTVYPCFFGDCTTCSDRKLSTDFGLDVRAVLPLGIGGSKRTQTIQIAATGQAVKVNGHLSGGGPSGSDDLQAQVNQQIQSQIPDQIASRLSIQFSAISVFALKNLLFPADNYISFSSSAIPGDMLLVGRFASG